MAQKDKTLNDLTKRLKEFLENQIQELESATTDIANNNAEFVGEITKVRANIISAVSKETDGGKLTGLNIKKDISLSDFMGDTSNLENLNFVLGLKHLKIKKNILNAIIKETQGGKLSGLDLDKTISLSDLLGESPKLNAVHALRWLRIKKTILKKVESAVKDVDVEIDNKVSLNDILGSTPEQDILTKARFFMIRQGLLKKISKAAKEFDPQQSVNEIAGGFGLTSVFSNKPSTAENNLNTLSTAENNLNTIGSSDAQLLELQGINKNVAKIHDHLTVNTPDVADTIENKKEQIKRDERRHDELIAALAGGGAKSKFLGGVGGGEGGQGDGLGFGDLLVADYLGDKLSGGNGKKGKKGLINKVKKFLKKGKKYILPAGRTAAAAGAGVGAAGIMGGLATSIGGLATAVGGLAVGIATSPYLALAGAAAAGAISGRILDNKLGITDKFAEAVTGGPDKTPKYAKNQKEAILKAGLDVNKPITNPVTKEVTGFQELNITKGKEGKYDLLPSHSRYDPKIHGKSTSAEEKFVPPAITAESQLPGSIVESVVDDKDPKNIKAQETKQKQMAGDSVPQDSLVKGEVTPKDIKPSLDSVTTETVVGDKKEKSSVPQDLKKAKQIKEQFVKGMQRRQEIEDELTKFKSDKSKGEYTYAENEYGDYRRVYADKKAQTAYTKLEDDRELYDPSSTAADNLASALGHGDQEMAKSELMALLPKGTVEPKDFQDNVLDDKISAAYVQEEYQAKVLELEAIGEFGPSMEKKKLQDTYMKYRGHSTDGTEQGSSVDRIHKLKFLSEEGKFDGKETFSDVDPKFRSVDGAIHDYLVNEDSTPKNGQITTPYTPNEVIVPYKEQSEKVIVPTEKMTGREAAESRFLERRASRQKKIDAFEKDTTKGDYDYGMDAKQDYRRVYKDKDVQKEYVELMKGEMKTGDLSAKYVKEQYQRNINAGEDRQSWDNSELSDLYLKYKDYSHYQGYGDIDNVEDQKVESVHKLLYLQDQGIDVNGKFSSVDPNLRSVEGMMHTELMKGAEVSKPKVVATDTMTGKKVTTSPNGFKVTEGAAPDTMQMSESAMADISAEKRREYDQPFQKMINDLSEDDKEKIRQGARPSRFLSPEQRETIQSGPLARSQSSTGRLAALKKFDLKAKGMLITGEPEVNNGPLTVKTGVNRIASPSDIQFDAPSAGSQIAMQQKANLDLASTSAGNTTSVIDASNKINNSKSSSSNITVAAPPHIDKTHDAFGKTALNW